MKFLSALFAAGAAATAVSNIATPIQERQSSGSAIARAALENIIASTSALSASLDAFDPNSQDSISNLQNAAVGLFTAVQTGADNVATIEPLTDQDTIDLAPLADGLTQGTRESIDKTIARKSDIANPPACLGTITYLLLTDLRPEAARFAANLRAATPALYQGVIDAVAASVDGDLARGQSAYADQATVPCNCDSSCTSTTTTATTTTTTSGDSSSTTTTTTTTTSGDSTTTTSSSTTSGGSTTTTSTTSGGSSTTTRTTSGGSSTTTRTTSGSSGTTTTSGTAGPTGLPPTTTKKPTTSAPTTGAPTSGIPTSKPGQSSPPSGTTSGKPYTTSKSPIATYTGAAAQMVANVGAVAIAAFAILL